MATEQTQMGLKLASRPVTALVSLLAFSLISWKLEKEVK